MWSITKEFAFEAAHHLPQMPDGHKCKNPHGHSYVVIVELRAVSLDDYGFVQDYGDLDRIKQFIDRELDHKDLAVVFEGGENTTAEWIARSLFHRFATDYPLLLAVTVKETAKTSARYQLEQT